MIQIARIAPLPRMLSAALLAALASFCAGGQAAAAYDQQALAQGFKDEDSCNIPFAKTRDPKAFFGCIQAVESKFKGTAAAKQSYTAGVGFNAWSLANYLADAVDKDLFPDIASRAKASKERQFAMKLFDHFRQPQKRQKIADTDLAKLAGINIQGLKPVLDYYDSLPKK